MRSTELRLKPHLAKFLYAIYGNPVRLPAGDEIYYDLLQVLTNSFVYTDAPIRHERLVSVTIILPMRNVDRFGHSVTEQQQHFLNQKLSKWFNKNCFIFINHLTTAGMPVRQAIAEVQQRFNITDEELTMDAFEQSYYRRKKEIKEIFDGNVRSNKKPELCHTNNPHRARK